MLMNKADNGIVAAKKFKCQLTAETAWHLLQAYLFLAKQMSKNSVLSFPVRHHT